MLSIQELRDKQWEKMYRLLVQFKNEHGHARVPSTWKDPSLAKWVSRQRENEEAMSTERRKKLNAIHFSWHSDILKMEEQSWEEKYRQLKEFYKKNKHFQIPSKEKDYHSLRIWVDKQRKDEKVMPRHRKEKLDMINFNWSTRIKANQNKNWNSMYEELVTFKDKYNHCRVNSHSVKHKKLGSWVLRQRKHWNKLDAKKRSKLEKLGFITSHEIEKEKRLKWISMLSLLKKYKKEHGDCRVPSKYSENPELGRWVEVQRLEEKNMPEWRKEKLKALGFEWSKDIKTKSVKHWYGMYDRLERFYKRFGHSCVPEYWEEDPKLYIWITYLRKPKKPLSPEKIALLKKVEFDWNPSINRPRKRNKTGQFLKET